MKFFIGLVVLLAVAIMLWTYASESPRNSAESIGTSGSEEAAALVMEGPGQASVDSLDSDVNEKLERRPSMIAAESVSKGAPIAPPPASYPASFLTHPAVLAAASYYQEDADILAREMYEAWPELAEREVGPLKEWSEPPLETADQILSGLIGSDSEHAQAILSWHLLDGEFDKVLDAAVDPYLEPEANLQARQYIGDTFDSVRGEYELYRAEYRVAVETLILQGRYDRWPYVTLENRRVHTESSGTVLMATVLGRPDGWVVGFEIPKGQFPLLESAQESWNTAKDHAADQIQTYLDSM